MVDEDRAYTLYTLMNISTRATELVAGGFVGIILSITMLNKLDKDD
jgi:hypothetical protein